MKKYLFGLGAMIVGAGLMFVLMHGEVEADSKPEVPEKFVCSGYANIPEENPRRVLVRHCVTKNLSCAYADVVKPYQLTCAKIGMFK